MGSEMCIRDRHNVEYAMLNQSAHVVQLMTACHLMLMCHLHPKIVTFSNETLLHDRDKESLCAVNIQPSCGKRSYRSVTALVTPIDHCLIYVLFGSLF